MPALAITMSSGAPAASSALANSGGVGQIRRHERDALAELGGQLGQSRFAGAREHDMGALPVQGLGDGPADAARGAGDEGGLAGEIEHDPGSWN
jgi:hypothetical protein